MIEPILITGFERSGTTLLRRLVSMHPILKDDLIHESQKLLKYKTPEEALEKYKIETKQAGQCLGSISSIKSGEKVPYVDSKFIIKYIKKWKLFWPDSIIFHLLRDCNACALSAYKTFSKDPKQTEKLYIKNVPIIIEFLKNYNNVHTIKFEELVGNSEKTLKRIYAIIGYIPDDECMHKILNTKEPWNYNGKTMCGLRYFDNVVRR